MANTNTSETKTFLVYTSDGNIITVEANQIKATEDYVWLLRKDGTEVAFFPTISIVGIVDQEADYYFKGR